MFYICNVKQLKNKKMKAINPTLITDNNTFKFVPFKSVHVDQIDVIYKGKRIAIINGIDGSALRWTAKNGSNIPIKVIEKLEKMAQRFVKQTINQNLKSK